MEHLGATLTGIITRKISERGFGFIEMEDGTNYFFHVSDLHEGFDFEALCEGFLVDFEVKRLPTEDGKAGAAQNVRGHVEVVEVTEEEPTETGVEE
ncbi:MAG TPA: cold shock domain-containing protein [Armatimonadota bacterium]|nr:cold shock domain-containing protein [Armatimonadota bacterium]